MQAEGGLSASRERDLWRRFHAAGDPRAREELIALHMPMARRMAARYAGVAESYDDLLAAFVAQRRMKLPGTTYRPVYRLVA